jgi:hypothetical protein
MSWLVVGLITLAYWSLLFLRMRARGRRDFDRAFEQAASTRGGNEPFEVKVAVETNPLRATAVVFAVPVALIVIRLLATRGSL